ncbi:leucine-rich repeat receptor-like serine/threonine-protein kinase At2g14510 isoform X2 [Dendrobium catenatum]|uniref:leucine-rich repeat receptor-like serine/threonine-protein kinase At2g14510 isoform X2 n=1 Tax=Dendrobium catenatum TaxID=906689 RepID=UPI0009F1F937|nr:leucine-rich repeat receptor-like serine/threonine-protein kinase At2g14510 isoform X2 [Dendrobium catenatum]
MEGEGIRINDLEVKDERKDRKTIVLGIRTDSKSRELLTWTLVNVAISGDRVVAIHVHRLSYPFDGSDQYVDKLEPMRRAYEGFCSLIQIDLVIKICRGFSVRRTLVQQAKSYSASYLILGETKSSNAIRFSLTSIPKYCATRLPPECSVVAVNNGKIVFGRGAVVKRRVTGHDGKTSNFLLLHRKSLRGDPLDCLLDIKGQEDAMVEKCSVCGTVPGTPCSSNVMADGCLLDSKSDAPICSNSSVAVGIQEPTDEVVSSWSIARRTMSNHRRTISMEGSRTPLVQLAKWISGRSTTCSPNRSVGKHRRSDTFTACSLYKEDSLSPFFIEESNLRINREYMQENYSLWWKYFSYVELMQATCNFSVDRVIGKGGSSLVYKGILSDGKELAVKALKPSKDSMRQFVLEIDIITTLNHENIISLLGFCLEDNNLLLIYDFMSRGSLEEILHDSEEHKRSLNWCDRYKISIAVTEALKYLHGYGGTEPVIHMDVKSSNILLSEDFVPKLSDFGLARRSTESVSHISCNNLAGTFGYLAPEYFMFGQVSTKTDVYAFGVVLLELLSGRRPINSMGIKGDQSLVMWAMPILQSGKYQELMDPRLDGKYDVEQMEWMALAASLCLKRDSQSRPTMPYVLKLLHGDKDSVKWAKSLVDSGNSINSEDDDQTFIPDIKSHLNVVLLNSEVGSPSASSNELLPGFTTDGTFVEDYLLGRITRASSLD